MQSLIYNFASCDALEDNFKDLECTGFINKVTLLMPKIIFWIICYPGLGIGAMNKRYMHWIREYLYLCIIIIYIIIESGRAHGICY